MTISKSHNKKRNSLLIYEFLVRTISKALIEDNKRKSSIALKILRRHFKPGTELHKEFRLMNALAKTTVSSEHVAASILKEAKSAVSCFNLDKLDKEKSILIKNINHNINDDNFYDQHVNEYRILATIQTLINEWRSSSKDLQRIGMFEDHLMKHLMAQKIQQDEAIVSEDSSGTTRLLMKVMTKKLNEKYSSVLNEQQRALVKAYAYSTAVDDFTSVKMKLSEIKDSLLQLIESYSTELQNNDYLNGKLNETKKVLLQEDLKEVNDDAVTRFMLYSRLKDELQSKE